MKTLEIISIGEELGVILPDDLVKKLRLEGRNSINIVEIPNGFRLIPHDPETVETIKLTKDGND